MNKTVLLTTLILVLANTNAKAELSMGMDKKTFFQNLKKEKSTDIIDAYKNVIGKRVLAKEDFEYNDCVNLNGVEDRFRQANAEAQGWSVDNVKTTSYDVIQYRSNLIGKNSNKYNGKCNYYDGYITRIENNVTEEDADADACGDIIRVSLDDERKQNVQIITGEYDLKTFICNRKIVTYCFRVYDGVYSDNYERDGAVRRHCEVTENIVNKVKKESAEQCEIDGCTPPHYEDISATEFEEETGIKPLEIFTIHNYKQINWNKLKY